MRFIGNIEAKIDAKGRAFLPAVFRKVLQASGEENLVLRKDVFQNCLVLYPESVWNERLDLLKSQLHPWKHTHQQMFRQFVSEAEVVTLDGNGRFLISKRLLKVAEIDQDICLFHGIYRDLIRLRWINTNLRMCFDRVFLPELLTVASHKRDAKTFVQSLQNLQKAVR